MLIKRGTWAAAWPLPLAIVCLLKNPVCAEPPAGVGLVAPPVSTSTVCNTGVIMYDASFRPEGTLSLRGLLALAVQSNPDLAIAQAQAEAARGRMIQAGLYPNPTVT